MAALQPKPTALTASTQLPPPTHRRNFSTSRSPSRSPTRKAQFVAQELDPLLRDLSPDSTLEALQEAEVIGGTQAEQNALVRSISDASEAERKLGVRAAIAAKKLREWTEEVNTWPWPRAQDRAWGAGFLSPSANDSGPVTYLGSLPETVVQKYEDRLDEIWDAVETLGIDDIKDYVFSSHLPSTILTQPTSSYGRMRDFTALITATVIQSLPVLANLHILLETWSIRLTVLREIPDLLTTLKQVKLGLVTVNDILSDDSTNSKLTRHELETGKVIFGNKVSHLGKRMDTLLDALEGQQDRLPRAWIDSLEDTEAKYAEWVARAEKIVLRNETTKQSPTTNPTNDTATLNIPLPVPALSVTPTVNPEKHGISPGQQSAVSTPKLGSIKRKPLLEINPRGDHGHKRGPSEVSLAESIFSNYSQENAEIIEARATPVTPSPRISVIDHQFPFEKANTTWMTTQRDTQTLSPPRPPFLQRASTASIETVPKSQIKKVFLRRSTSHDMLAGLNTSRGPHSTSFPDSASASPQIDSRPSLIDLPVRGYTLPPLVASPSPSLRVDPLSLKGKSLAELPVHQRPIVPRRSSKRLSMPLLGTYQKPTTTTSEDPTKIDNTTAPRSYIQPDRPAKADTFDDKLKTILASMPTKIRLTEASDSGRSATNSESSSRSNSPSRPLKLSPVKDSKLARQNVSSGIRVYHLKGGQSSNVTPIKLFVRPVGENGERIMVRVGGGWADLAEYLKEYSLHHRSRGLAERKLEVANLPGSSASHLAQSRAIHMPDQQFDFGLEEKASDSTDNRRVNDSPWRPPPMPIVPANHSLPMAISTRQSSQRDLRASTPKSSTRPNSRTSTVVTVTPAITTSVTSSSKYTPLGGAGPAQSSRRTTSQNFTRTPSNEAWVEGMVSQARAVSGSQPSPHTHTSPHLPATPGSTNKTIATAPSITTTTVFSNKTRKSGSATKRLSSWSTTPTPSIINKTTDPRPQITISPVDSFASSTSRESNKSAVIDTPPSGKNERRRSRLNLGDVGGIRRVFLRKKSDR